MSGHMSLDDFLSLLSFRITGGYGLKDFSYKAVSISRPTGAAIALEVSGSIDWALMPEEKFSECENTMLSKATESVSDPLRVTAEIRTDDNHLCVTTDVTAYFEKASDYGLEALIQGAYSSCEAAKNIAIWAGIWSDNKDPNVSRLLKYVETANRDWTRQPVAFNVHVHCDQARRWLKRYRPKLFLLDQKLFKSHS